MKPRTELVERLEWDSNFFGFGVGRVRSSRLRRDEAVECFSQARQLGLRCLYFLAAAGDPASWRHATAAGFLPVDVRIELELQQGREPPAARELGAELASRADLADLLRLSAHAFGESRFFRDPGFPREKADELFRIWVSRGVQEAGFFTVLERDAGVPAGFVTGRALEAGRGRIELVAVDASRRGHGVGTRLLASAKAEFFRRALTTLSVATQGSNLGAQRLYQEAGFRTASVGLWLHGWL